MDNILSLLTTLGIPFTRHDHPAVFTCAESEKLEQKIPGAHTKQLLMKAKNKDICVLAIVMHDKRVDTKTLAKSFGAQSFSFASPELLMELLDVTPGSVTPFGLTHDTNHRIQVLVDIDAWNTGLFAFHPMVNTATLNIDKDGFEKFLKYTGHGYSVRKIPTSNPIT